MKLIVLSGPKQSGKDTTALHIKKYIPQLKCIALADKLKNECSQIFNIPRNFFDDQDLKEKDLGPFGYNGVVSIDKVIKLLLNFDINPRESGNSIGSLELPILHSAREIAQWVGTDLLRKYGNPDIHCVQLKKILSKAEKKDVFVVMDCRFPNELEFLQSFKDAVTCYIQRDIAESKVTSQSHISEKSTQELKNKVKYIIDNNGSFEDLDSRVLKLINTTSLI